MSLIVCHYRQHCNGFSCCESDTTSLGYRARGHVAQSVCTVSVLLDKTNPPQIAFVICIPTGNVYEFPLFQCHARLIPYVLELERY